MKTLLKISLIFAVAAMLYKCTESTVSPVKLTEDAVITTRGAEITVPFKVDYLGTYTFQGPDSARCPGYVGFINVIVDGEGTGTHVGNSIIHFDFCVNGNDLTYGDSYAYIVAANGDSIFISVEGQVIPGRLEDHPEYVTSFWRDTFYILDGTGRFEGATGQGITDDYNSSEDPFSHHDWDGTITMLKGNQ